MGTQYIKAQPSKREEAFSLFVKNAWDDLLANLGVDLGAQISQTVIENAPLSQSIVVKVDGQITTAWSYVGAAHAIKFNPDSLPRPWV